MNLIESYVKEIGRRLPSKQRADVEAELRSLLADMVEDRAQTKLEQADEETVVAVLREFGSPKQVADAYQPAPRYLIGPGLFPIFKIVVTVVTAVLASLTVVNAILSAQTSTNMLLNITQVIIYALPDLAGQLLAAFGQITIIFAILERIIPEDELADVAFGDDQTWDPHQLKEMAEATSVKIPDLVASVVATALLLLLLNFFSEWAGFIYFDSDETAVVPILAANVFTHLLPWINVMGLLSIGFSMVQLRVGRRTRLIRWGEVVMGILTAVFLILAITQQPLLAINPNHGYSGDALDFVSGIRTLLDTLNTLLQVALPLLLLLTLGQTGKKLYDLWRSAANSPSPKFA